MSDRYDHIFVSVHGIGKQQRSATVRSVANRLASSGFLFKGGKFPFYPQPLGYFDGLAGVVKAFPLDSSENGIAVAEVFWADVPQSVVDEGRTIEETKAWAHTVVARARNAFQRSVSKVSPESRTVPTPDFGLASEVLDEIIDTVRVIEKLSLVGSFAGLPKLDVRTVFEEFLGDVQLMAEFRQTRNVIIGRFQETMKQLCKDHPNAKFHIVAHSEGTVVSFLGMLYAMSGKLYDQEKDGMTTGNELQPWVKQIQSYMTIGSPIDKHLLLWPGLFKNLDLQAAASHYDSDGAAKIRWKNYFDFGDPIGFRLDSARRWLAEAERKCTPFAFTGDDDHGFARYLFPGKAHNDYWGDRAVFDHYFESTGIDVKATKQEINKNESKPVAAPKSDWRVACLSPIIPYILSFLLFGVAVAVLNYPFIQLLKSNCETRQFSFFEIFGMTSLLAGLTLASRIPRLAAGWRSIFWGMAAFAIGAAIYCTTDPDFRELFGSVFKNLPLNETFWTISASALISILGYSLSAKRHWFKGKEAESCSQGLSEVDERSPRWFRKGMRPLLFSGVLIVGAMLVHRLGGSVALRDSIPVIVGSILFFYLWWFAALIFDLGFVWQRYIRRSLLESRLEEWRRTENP